MAGKIRQPVLISEVYFDEDLYPRSSFNWQTSYDYSQSIRTGAQFPDIILAVHNKRKYLVDGKHRIEAHKVLKKKTINAVIYTGWDKKKIFLEAVKANMTHGRTLSPYEKRKIAMKLLELKYVSSEISKIIQVPLDKLERFVAERTVNTLTGTSGAESAETAQQIAQIIVKSGAKHYSGQTLPIEMINIIESTQKDWDMHSQETLLNQLIDLIENDLLDINNDKIAEKFEYLKNLIIKGAE